MRRIALGGLVVLSIAGLLAPPGTSLIGSTDGITAFTATPSGIGNEVFRPDANGNLIVRIRIFADDGSGWTQVAANGIVKADVLVQDSASVNPAVSTDPISVGLSASASAKVARENKVSIPFTSPVNGAVDVAFPASAISNPTTTGTKNVVDLYIEFDNGGSSHHSIVKNQLINANLYDQADGLDDGPGYIVVQ